MKIKLYKKKNVQIIKFHLLSICQRIRDRNTARFVTKKKNTLLYLLDYTLIILFSNEYNDNLVMLKYTQLKRLTSIKGLLVVSRFFSLNYKMRTTHTCEFCVSILIGRY